MKTQLVLAFAAKVGLLLGLLPSTPAQAQVDPDTIVSAHHVQTVGQRDLLTASLVDACRGVRLRADEDATLVSFGLEMEYGWPEPISYYVYESPTEMGTYTRIDAASRLLVAQGSFASVMQFHMAPSVAVPLEAGNFYVALECWDTPLQGDIQIWQGQGGNEDLPFGEYLGGVDTTHSSLNPSQSFTSSPGGSEAHFRLVTSAGHPVNMAPEDMTQFWGSSWGSSSYPSQGGGMLLGNTWSVTSDRVLLGFDQLVDVSAPPNGSFSVTWVVMSCPTPSAGSCNLQSPWTVETSGTESVDLVYDTYENPVYWLSVDEIRHQLDAGRDYFLGLWWTEFDLGALTWYTAPLGGYTDPDWGVSNLQLTSLSQPPVSGTFVFSSSQSALRSVQQVYTVEEKFDEIPDSMQGDAIGADGVRGNVFSIANWGSTRLKEVSVETTSHRGSEVTLGVYMSTGSSSGPWSLIESRSLELFGHYERKWHSSGALDVDLDTSASGYYMIALWADGAESLGTYDSQMLVPHGGFDFGTMLGRYEEASLSSLPTSLPASSNLDPEWLAMRISTCDDCVDLDLDGVPLSEDCDDADPANFPGNSELCDGQDNDCDQNIDEGFDSDGDNWTSCGGDCDDDNSSIYPWAPELCDGIDNNCNSSIDEGFDQDNDGVLSCEGDCDDNDGMNYPGSFEYCDGQDNDCDSLVDEDFDGDGDGFSDQDAMECAGMGPLDCDDQDPLTYPAATELCDGVDNDCDGQIEEDKDEDGFYSLDTPDCELNPQLGPFDCDDGDEAIHPGAEEQCDDAIDNDCDGDIDLEDEDCFEEPADDDDSVSDDDDSVSDDDDSVDDEDLDDPSLVDSDSYDPPELVSGCTGCVSSQAGGLPYRGGLLSLLLLLMSWRRQRGVPSGGLERGGRLRLGLLLAVTCFGFGLTTPAPALAQVSAEADGQRHLENAWKELEAKQWDRAIESARSARRLIPSEHSALLVWALAYEGKGMLKKSQSYLLTYGELMRGLSNHAEAQDLLARLEQTLGGPIGPDSWKGEKGGRNRRPEVERVEVTVGRQAGAFGDGYVVLGGLVGARAFAQRPCDGDGICSSGSESRPGLWAYSGSGVGSAISLRAEYFFAGSFVGARLRFDLSPSQPVGHYGIESPAERLNYRVDANIVGRIPLSRGRVGVELLLDFAYGLRSFDVFGSVSPTEATFWTFFANQAGAGLGLRIEPGRRLGIEARGGAVFLLKPSGGLSETTVELAAVIRPTKSLVVRLAGDFRRSTWIFQQEDELTEVRDLVAGAWAGVGVSF